MKLSRTTIVSFVLFGREIRSLILKERRRIRVLDNRLLKKIFGSKKGDMAGNLGNSSNEGFHDFYCSPNIIGVIK